MTVPTSLGLQTALSGLEANQIAINTTGENITNVNTPGYTRQSAVAAERDALAIPSLDGVPAQIGTGVDISTISRIRDQFLDIQYRAQNSASSGASTLSGQLQQVQAAVNEPSTSGISSQLSAFWSSWSTLANNPPPASGSAAALQNVVDKGQALAATFQAVSGQMATVQSQAGQQYASLTGSAGTVQADASQIASLNSQISQQSQAGQSPNTLLDQRDKLLDNLSSLAQISVTNQSNGMVSVKFGDAATPLVSGTTVTWPQTITAASGGQLGALLNLTSSTGPIGTLSSALNTVAGQVISSVNALQPTSPFFSGNSASTIAVSATPASVQSSSSSSSGADLATAVAALQGGAADQSYSAFVGQVGSGVQSAQSTQLTAKSLLSAIDNQRQSVSGVSLDEEMANLVTYQQGYQASARVMSTVDSMLNTLINQTGAGL